MRMMAGRAAWGLAAMLAASGALRAAEAPVWLATLPAGAPVAVEAGVASGAGPAVAGFGPGNGAPIVTTAAASGGPSVLWRSSDGGAVPVRIRDGAVPLGSTWKLFTWLYLVGNDWPEKGYTCAAVQPEPGDEYCCDPGQRIDRDQALVRSCGAYFEPRRLGIRSDAWRAWWQQRAPGSPWLQELSQLAPARAVPVADLLQALAQVPPREREQARQVLLGRLLQPRWQGVLAGAGSAYRFKTYTWDDPARPGGFLGGGAGWLASGQPFWLGGEGRSIDVLARVAPQLPVLLPAPETALADVAPGQCVDVAFFGRYPLARVLHEDGRPALAGRLHGRYRAQFANGRELAFDGNGQLRLALRGGAPAITARLGLEEYVARVIDREGDAEAGAAAQALAVAARSWLRQNARFEHGCWQASDDTRTQRVSANPPTAAAWRAAWSTEGLVLGGQPVLYHLDKADGGRLSWQQAVAQARAGQDFVDILRAAYPQASFTLPSGQDSCRRLPVAEDWLRRQLPKARELLQAEPGYEPVPALQVCQLSHGNPYSDQRQQRLWIRRLGSADDRVALWHEYLHLAFRDHPAGGNEAWIEALARRLGETL